MHKVPFIAVFWTMILAIPLTALALSGLAFVTENLTDIIGTVVAFGKASTVGGRGMLQVAAERWPEVAGMIVGQIVLMTILIFVRRERQEKEISVKKTTAQ